MGLITRFTGPSFIAAFIEESVFFGVLTPLYVWLGCSIAGGPLGYALLALGYFALVTAWWSPVNRDTDTAEIRAFAVLLALAGAGGVITAIVRFRLLG